MNYLQLATRSLFKKKRSDTIKIISLGTGLAIGLILITKVLYEQSYDHFYPEADRLYLVSEKFHILADHTRQAHTHPRVPGGIAGGVKEEAPGVVSVTLSTFIEDDAPLFTQERKRLKGNIIMADSSFFDVVPRPMISGNAKEALSRPLHILVSEGFASKMEGEPMGQSLEPENMPGLTFTVAGVFKDLPKNSTFNYDIILSFESVSKIWGWEPRNNWIGNDRYSTIFKLAPGINPEDLEPAIRQMRKKHIPDEKLVQYGLELEFSIQSFPDHYKSQDDVKRANLLLSLIALAILAAAVLNYILITISTLVNRSKEIAVYKCYGAKNAHISKLFLTETVLHLLLSLISAFVLIFLFRNTVEELLGASLASLFTSKTCLILFGICLMVLFIAGYLPSRIFTGIPVTSVFRNFGGNSKRSWKLALLFVEFAGAAFLIILLSIVTRQYRTMTENDVGYEYENIVYFPSGATDSISRTTALNKLMMLPDVEIVASGANLLFDGQAGNNISLPGEEQELFNAADLYHVDENYIPLHHIKMIAGESFDKNKSTRKDIIVSRSFADRMADLTGWQDGVIGKTVDVSQHGKGFTIRGVYENVRIGYIGEEDFRPSVMFYANKPQRILFFRLREIKETNLEQIRQVIQEAMPDKEIHLQIYKNDMLDKYSPAKRFHNAVLIGSVITLIIVLLGLIGYLRNEIARRKKEIAIRKVNGAEIKDILWLFTIDIMRLAIPSIIVGAVSSYFVALKWMEDFSVKTSMPWWLFLGCTLIILTIIIAVIVMNCMRIAYQNPTQSLKTE